MSHKNKLVAALMGTVPVLLALSIQAAVQDTAAIMPLASRSLLLDISTADDRLVVAGEHGNILYSDDNGNNWEQGLVPTTQMLTGVHFVDGQHGWAVGHDGLILVSDDGGNQWRLQRDGLAVQHQNNLELRETTYRRLGELERELKTANEETVPALKLALEDAQMDLEDAELALEEPVFTYPFMDVWFQDLNRGWAVGAFGTFVGTADGGQHWVNQASELDNPDEFHLNAITGDSKGRVFIAGEGGVMFRSMDGGRNWEALEPFYEGSWFGVVYSAPNDSLFLFGLRGNLYRSSDFGTTWESVPNDSNSALAGGSSSEGGDILLVGGVGTVLFSSDGGQSFQRTMMEDRLSLTSGISRGDKIILVGQGGAKVSEVADLAN